MTVGELKKALKGYDETAEVYLVRDWIQTNEMGEITSLSRLREVVDQRVVIDTGFVFEDETQVLLDFEEDII